ncbi:Putative branched-chain amino acid transport protein (ATP binding protein); livG-like protein [Bradyrhizobium sp. ORS 285]|uniref:ABC transporter ATP-binding protein n=1 Tax=Bradyrhizobium sp. ORS 285 TaxID=115808 RepID=UPI000240A025|nr:ABC transporter ATP-binding protein [Bradyrhizobium sp. ORS 285]CCD86970.1 putative branched-chain amino acid transport protein (ATP binding protein); livG-like protein [Bradyrhizobium sp. ORS 285]SMX56898.1 Putative branched-chain amino acid transport protein (ATP binding protein); livG-like protein [Bradyrhizobium sp. ORS 285]
MLEVKSLTKRFSGLVAVDQASLSVAKGSITGLIGPNGAGKTTLFAMVAGFLQPDGGSVSYDGRDITALAPHVRARQGIARTFQIVQPFEGLNVQENIAVGAYLHTPDAKEAMQQAAEIAKRVGLGADLAKASSDLTVAGRKRLEVARALATRPKLLLLDEVLAGLNPSEIRDVLPLVRDIRDQGITILMIEHIMQAVMNLCDKVYVLSQGRMIAEGEPRAVCEDPQVIEAYLGHGAAERLRAEQAHA